MLADGQRHYPAALPPPPKKKYPIRIVQEAGRAPGLVWTGAKNLVTTEIRFSDRPAHSESLYRLSYPGPLLGPFNLCNITVLQRGEIMLLFSTVYFVLLTYLRSRLAQ